MLINPFKHGIICPCLLYYALSNLNVAEHDGWYNQALEATSHHLGRALSSFFFVLEGDDTQKAKSWVSIETFSQKI